MEVDRLRQIWDPPVGGRREAPAVRPCHEDGAHARVRVSYFLEQFQSVTIGQIHVEQDHVETIRIRQRADGLVGGTYRVGIKPVGPQQILQSLLRRPFIFNYEYFHIRLTRHGIQLDNNSRL
jgi:hypothetical protein